MVIGLTAMICMAVKGLKLNFDTYQAKLKELGFR